MRKVEKKIKWVMGIGDWGLGVWAPTPNPQTPKPNPT